MTTAVLALLSVCGFQMTWTVQPASAGASGSVSVSAILEEGDFVFVTDQGVETASYEVIASLDEGSFTRTGGTVARGSLPLEVTLVLGGVESGSHELLVIAGDIESGRRRTRQETVEVPELSADRWSAGALVTRTGPSGRAAGTVRISWSIYPPSGTDIADESLDVAYVLRSDAGIVQREGWMQRGANGVHGADIVLNGIEAGRYQLLAAAVSGGSVVAAAGSSLDVREDWDVWGRDAGRTASLVRPIATTAELHALEDAGSSTERMAVMSEFWQRRDPTPHSGGNEYLEEYLGRLDLIMDRFSVFGIDGISTDMGRVYALLGEPDQVEDMPFETDSEPYQIWTYYSPPLTVVFLDRGGFGMYELTTPWDDVRRAYEN